MWNIKKIYLENSVNSEVMYIFFVDLGRVFLMIDLKKICICKYMILN